MKQTATIISTYAADISGICSAMYELGGMTVMHDASGCNSTYNTHDEPRWYDMDSLVFISGLSETEAILGDDDKLINDTVAAANALNPKFITLGGTPIPMMIGTDFEAVAYQIENETGITTFGLNTDGMHSYISGASKAFAALAQRICRKDVPKDEKLSVNILGATPLDFSVNGSIKAMKQALQSHGIEVHSVWAMGTEYEYDTNSCSESKCQSLTGEAAKAAADKLFYQIETSSVAHVNLVVSACGLKAARILQQRFGMPYVIGTPYGTKFIEKVAESIKTAAQTGMNKNIFNDMFNNLTNDAGNDIIIIGESITSRSFASALYLETGKHAKVLCGVDSDDEVLSEQCVLAVDEAEIIPYLAKAKMIIADPMYRLICPKNTVFVALPHEGFSGRIYRDQIPQLVSGFEKFIEKAGLDL